MKKILIAGAGVAALAVAAMPILGASADVIDTVQITISSACSVASDLAANIDPQSNPGTGQTFTATMTNNDVEEWDANGTGGELYITCNDTHGWNVTAQGYSSDTPGTTTMVPADSGTAIPTGTTLTAGTSNWAFKIADSNTGATIVTGYTSYSQVPADAARIAYKANAQGSPSMVSESLIYTGYKVSTSATQEADTYTGKVKYVVNAGVGQ